MLIKDLSFIGLILNLRFYDYLTFSLSGHLIANNFRIWVKLLTHKPLPLIKLGLTGVSVSLVMIGYFCFPFLDFILVSEGLIRCGVANLGRFNLNLSWGIHCICYEAASASTSSSLVFERRSADACSDVHKYFLLFASRERLWLPLLSD